jgi:hypothetical protein
MKDIMEDNNALSPEEPKSVSTARHLVVFGKHDYIVENAERLLTKGGYVTKGFTLAADAVEYIKMNQVDGIFVGGGVDPHDLLGIKTLIGSDFPAMRVIDHFGGPATILSEVEAAFRS